jgi:hypothetical protein
LKPDGKFILKDGKLTASTSPENHEALKQRIESYSRFGFHIVMIQAELYSSRFQLDVQGAEWKKGESCDWTILDGEQQKALIEYRKSSNQLTRLSAPSVAVLNGQSSYVQVGTQHGIKRSEVDGVKPASAQTAPSRLKQDEQYRVDSGDILGVFVEGILPNVDTNSPPQLTSGRVAKEDSSLDPSLGYPIVVQENGTIALPSIAPIHVKGMTINQIRNLIHKAYTDAKIVKEGVPFEPVVTILKERDSFVETGVKLEMIPTMDAKQDAIQLAIKVDYQELWRPEANESKRLALASVQSAAQSTIQKDQFLMIRFRAPHPTNPAKGNCLFALINCRGMAPNSFDEKGTSPFSVESESDKRAIKHLPEVKVTPVFEEQVKPVSTTVPILSKIPYVNRLIKNNGIPIKPAAQAGDQNANPAMEDRTKQR